MDLTQIIVAAIVTAGGIAVAIFANRKGGKADSVAADNVETSQIFTGYGSLVRILQEDNVAIRSELALCRSQMEAKVKVLDDRITSILNEKK